MTQNKQTCHRSYFIHVCAADALINLAAAPIIAACIIADSRLSLLQEMQLLATHRAKPLQLTGKQTDAVKLKKRKKKARHGKTLKEAAVQPTERKAAVLPAEETWHSVPSKAGYRTLLSLQPLQTHFPSYQQHSEEKSSKKSHRFERYCSISCKRKQS